MTIYYGDWEFDTKAGPLSKPRRTVSDLETNGWCIDHVEIKQSNIEGAGRGLFTKRRLPAGTTVVPAPLQVFEDRSIFPRPNGQEQLFINYCLQPPNSNMMVYPYGPGCNLINHSRNPNVGLRWSDKNLHHGEFLLLENASEFFQKGWPGSLVLEFYALRDLRAGEEILLDYGDAWQAAWDEHVANWTPPPGADDYVYPEDMDNAAQLLTVEEQKEKPYPSSIMVGILSIRATPLASSHHHSLHCSPLVLFSVIDRPCALRQNLTMNERQSIFNGTTRNGCGASPI